MAINGIKHNLPPASVRWGDQVDRQLATLGNKTNNTNKNVRGATAPSITYVPVPGQGFRILTDAAGDPLTWNSTTTYQIGDVVRHPNYNGAFIASTTVNTNAILPIWGTGSNDKKDFVFFTLPQMVYQYEWDSSAPIGAYKLNDVVYYKGSTWLYQGYQENAEPGTDGTWLPVAIGLHFAGTWDSSTKYITGDYVYYGTGNSLYFVTDGTLTEVGTPPYLDTESGGGFYPGWRDLVNSPNFVGSWSSTLFYGHDALVKYQGVIYRNNGATTGIDPSQWGWEVFIPSTLTASTSSTSLSVGTGAKTFTTIEQLGVDVGSRLHLARTSDPNSIYLEGTVTSISGTSVTINSDLTLGSGAYTDWTVTLTGARGPQGIQGPPGTDSTIPTGSVTMFAGLVAPNGWLLCDGLPFSRTAYSDLFSVIGTAYGAGDGTTTFNLPDFRGYFPIGAQQGPYELGASGGTSAHTHELGSNAYAQIGVFGSNVAGKHVDPVPAWTQDAVTAGSGGTTTSRTKGAALAGETNLASTLPPYLAINFIIKT